jgi:hypothetical protein
MTVTPVDEAATRREALRQTITTLVHQAKREFAVVERYTTDPPTPWTRYHQRINHKLDELERT